MAGSVLTALLAVVVIGMLAMGVVAVPRVDGRSALLPAALSGRPALVSQTEVAPSAPPPRARAGAVASSPPTARHSGAPVPVPPPLPEPLSPVEPVSGPIVPTTTVPPAPAAVSAKPREPVRGAEVLAGLDYPWQTLGFSVSFLPSRPGVFGATFLEERRIEIYVRPGQSDLELAHVVAHELGHAVDVTYGTAQRRREWMRLRGIDPSLDWWGCLGCRDYATPAGDFAEVFAYWLAGPASGFKGRLAGPPLVDDLHLLTPFFWP